MQKLRNLRKAQGKTQAQMAIFLGITQQAYATYENDKAQPPLDIVQKLADYFGVSVDYLLGREEKKTVTNPDENKIEIMARGGFTCSYTFSDDEMETARRILETIKKSQGIPTKDKKDK